MSGYICFEDESGQGLSPPRGHTWAERGARPVVHVRGRGQGRVNAAGVVCFREGHRSHFYYKLHVYHGRKDEPKSFSWQDYRDLIVVTHQQLGTPVVWVWDNLNVHLVQEMYDFSEENKAWLRVFQLPSYAPELNPTEWVWSLLKRGIVNFVATNITGLERTVKRKLKKIQYRPDLIDGCLAGTGLIIMTELIDEPELADST